MKTMSTQKGASSGLIVVEASAGSGKTYALAKRYLRLLLTAPSAEVPAVLRSILAITFTNKATIEMKERIIELLKRIAFDDFDNEVLRKDLLHGIALSKKALQRKAQKIMDDLLAFYSFFQVQTIDSFINAILSGSALRIDRSAHFKIQRDYTRLLGYSLDSVIDQAAEDSSVLGFLEEFLMHYLLVENHTGWFPRKEILELMVSLFTLSNRFGCRFTPAGSTSSDIISLKKQIFEQIQDFSSRMPEGINKTAEKSIAKFVAEHSGVFSLADLPAVFQKDAVPLNKKFTCPDDTAQKWKHIKQNIKTVIQQDAESVYDPYIKLYNRFISFFKGASKKEDVLFLEELNHVAGSLFEEDGITVAELYYRLAARFRHYLIDEFQDTSVLQWRNLKTMVEEGLSTGGSFFYVGDKKQAIYRFRGGELQLFDRVRKDFGHFNTMHTRLLKNWRSQKAIVEFNNTIFSRKNLSAALSDSGIEVNIDSADNILDVFKDTEQSFRDDKPYGYVYVERIDEKNKEERDSILHKKIVDVLDELKNRFAREDIALLTRDNAEVELLTMWLLEAGIPVESEKTLNVLENQRIKELLALLKFLHSPVDNISFAAFILGELFLTAANLKREEVAAFIFNAHKDGMLKGGAALYNLFKKKFPVPWDTYIAEFFKNAGFVSTYEMLVSIYQGFKLVETFNDTQGFFMKFLELVKNKESEYRGLNEFLQYCETAPVDDLYVHVAGTDAVKILTVHKAKGLEFPVVIIPFLRVSITPETGGKGTSSYVVEKERGESGLIRITKNSRAYSDKLNKIYAQAYTKASIDELNIVYVSLTRAKDELYVFIPKKSGNSKNAARFFVPEDIREIGGKKIYKRESVKEQELMDIPASKYCDWIEKLKNEFFDGDIFLRRKQVEYGTILHALLAHAGNCQGADVNKIVSNASAYARDLFVSVKDFSEYEEKLKSLLMEERLKSVFFVDKSDVFCEKEVINRYGDARRIDRLIVGLNDVWIIDYKSTNDKEQEYIKQIKEYGGIMRDIFPEKKIKGSLLYFDEMKLKDVEM